MTTDDAMIWFGVMIAMTLQTSFLTPPFGFALFYLRSVAAKFAYKDRITGVTIPAVETSEIYKGSIAFIILQLIMVAAIMIFPNLVTGGIEKVEKLTSDQVMEQLLMPKTEEEIKQEAEQAEAGSTGADAKPAESKEEDPMKALLEANEKDQKKK
jgi:hypothetical protein